MPTTASRRQGVDMDSLMPLIQLAFLVVSTKLILMLRRDHAAAHTGSDMPTPDPGGTVRQRPFTESAHHRHRGFTAISNSHDRPSK